MSDQHSPIAVATGWFLVILGGLWVLLTGGCTLAVTASSILSFVKSPSLTDMGPAPSLLAIGAVCIAPGAVMFWLGLRMLRRTRPPGSG